MNVYNIRKATQGLANYLNASDLPKKVAIGTTAASRAMCSQKKQAAVLAANGIKAYIYPRLEPTPALSWGGAVLRLRRRCVRYRQPQSRQVQRLQGLRRRRLPDHP